MQYSTFEPYVHAGNTTWDDTLLPIIGFIAGVFRGCASIKHISDGASVVLPLQFGFDVLTKSQSQLDGQVIHLKLLRQQITYPEIVFLSNDHEWIIGLLNGPQVDSTSIIVVRTYIGVTIVSRGNIAILSLMVSFWISGHRSRVSRRWSHLAFCFPKSLDQMNQARAASTQNSDSLPSLWRYCRGCCSGRGCSASFSLPTKKLLCPCMGNCFCPRSKKSKTICLQYQPLRYQPQTAQGQVWRAQLPCPVRRV